MYDRGHIRPMPTPGAKRIKVPDSCRLGHQSIADNLPCSVSRVQLGLNQRPWVTVLTPVTTAPCGPRYTPPPSRPSQYPLANLLIPRTRPPPPPQEIKMLDLHLIHTLSSIYYIYMFIHCNLSMD